MADIRLDSVSGNISAMLYRSVWVNHVQSEFRMKYLFFVIYYSFTLVPLVGVVLVCIDLSVFLPHGRLFVHRCQYFIDPLREFAELQ